MFLNNDRKVYKLFRKISPPLKRLANLNSCNILICEFSCHTKCS